MGKLDELIDRIEDAGEVVAEGTFTLDRARAREKMQRFALEDPQRYVLLLAQAAAAKGARRLVFDIDEDDMRLAFDGEPFSREDLDGLYMFSGRGDGPAIARRELALALVAAMGLEPRWVMLESGDGERGVRLHMQPDREDRIELADGVQAGTRVHVKGRFGLGTVARFARDLVGTLPEERLIREHCRWAPYEVIVGDESVSQGFALDVVAPVTRRGDGFELLVGFASGARQATLKILARGVWVTTHVLSQLPPEVVAMVDVAALNKDVAQRDVVRDAAYETLLRDVTHTYEQALGRLVDMAAEHLGRGGWHCAPLVVTPGHRGKVLPLWVRSYLERELVGRPLTTRGRRDTRLLGKLRSLRLFRTLDDHPISARELASHPRVVVAGESVLDTDIVDFPHAVHASDPATRATLEAVFGQKLQDLDEARVNRRVQSSRHDRRAPRVASALVRGVKGRQPIVDDGITGELALRTSGSDPPSVALWRDGRLLAERELKGAPDGLAVVVDASFAVTVLEGEVACDATLERTGVAILRALHRMMVGFAGPRGTRRPGRAIRHALVQYLVGIRGELSQSIFEGLGFGRRDARALARDAEERVPAPALGLGTADPGVLARVSLLTTVGGDAVSLAELHGRVAELGAISYIPADARGAIADVQASVLRLDATEQLLLQTVFGAEQLRAPR